MFGSKNFEIIKSKVSRNRRDQFCKNLKKNLIKSYKKFWRTVTKTLEKLS